MQGRRRRAVFLNGGEVGGVILDQVREKPGHLAARVEGLAEEVFRRFRRAERLGLGECGKRVPQGASFRHNIGCGGKRRAAGSAAQGKAGDSEGQSKARGKFHKPLYCNTQAGECQRRGRGRRNGIRATEFIPWRLDALLQL